MNSLKRFLIYFLVGSFCTLSCNMTHIPQSSVDLMEVNAIQANEAFSRSHRFVEGWLKWADPVTGLIPRNLNGDDYWNAKDAAADNYSFMVITSYLTDPDLFEGQMKDMLSTETLLTSCLGACPAPFDFRTQRFCDNPVDTLAVIFGSAEYVKDGLLPVTELLGPSLWSTRMLSILDDLHKLITVAQPGTYPAGSGAIEVNGDLLQALSRAYWFTGKEEYLDWAIEIGDYLLLNEIHPVEYDAVMLRDHGCEFILGLCELYATLSQARPAKREEYKAPLHRLLDRILEVGRNEDGLFYNAVNLLDGNIVNNGIADTWGYTLDGFYTVYLLDGDSEYRDAVSKVFGNLEKYRKYPWEPSGPSDGYADSIESALNLYNRERSANVASWIDGEIQNMFAIQKSDGVIEGWHGDGNFARTSMMYALWKTQGTHIAPWREDVLIGAAEKEKGIFLTIKADQAWEGKLYFDLPRHKEHLHLPFDWPRINQFPEWFVVEKDKRYSVNINGRKHTYYGSELIQGLDISVAGGQYILLEVTSK